MKRTAFDAYRDQQAAEHFDDDRELMCAASGCPRRWTVSVGGDKGKCSAHAWADASLWPRITQQLLDQDADRARRQQRPAQQPRRLSGEEKLQTLHTMRANLCKKTFDKSWARELQSRENEGECLSEFQRKAWREALRNDHQEINE